MKHVLAIATSLLLFSGCMRQLRSVHASERSFPALVPGPVAEPATALPKPPLRLDAGERPLDRNRDDLVVILAGYADRMDKFFQNNPGFRSRIAHHIDFPDYSDDELLSIAGTMLDRQNYELTTAARSAMAEYIVHRRGQPHFANARSLRNALDRARLRQANRLFQSAKGPLDAAALSTIEEADIRASRVFQGGLDVDRKGVNQ